MGTSSSGAYEMAITTWNALHACIGRMALPNDYRGANPMKTQRINVKELTVLIENLKRTFDGDSNDEEHDAAVELVDYLEEHKF